METTKDDLDLSPYSEKIIGIGVEHSLGNFTNVISTVCQRYKEHNFHIFNEMSLNTNITSNENCTIIPEMELTNDEDEDEDVRSAMFFLVNIFLYMKNLINLLVLFGDDLLSKHNTTNTIEYHLQEVETYLNITATHRLKEQFFSQKYKTLYDNLNKFVTQYKTSNADTLKGYFTEIINECVNNKIFEDILKLDKKYLIFSEDEAQEKENNRMEIKDFDGQYKKLGHSFNIKPPTENGNITEGQTNYDTGWAFIARDIYHAYKIKKYIKNLETYHPETYHKSIFIIHKGYNHFIQPHEYPFKVGKYISFIKNGQNNSVYANETINETINQKIAEVIDGGLAKEISTFKFAKNNDNIINSIVQSNFQLVLDFINVVLPKSDIQQYINSDDSVNFQKLLEVLNSKNFKNIVEFNNEAQNTAKNKLFLMLSSIVPN